jgi:Fur family ferric uptake transcriptional regulator
MPKRSGQWLLVERFVWKILPAMENPIPAQPQNHKKRCKGKYTLFLQQSFIFMAKENSQGLLKRHKLRQTAIRIQVLEIFLGRADAVGQADLEQLLGPVDRITLYRTLRAFEEQGIIHRALDATGKLKFALCAGDCSTGGHFDAHAHLYCERCERTLCLDDIAPPAIPAHANFQVNAAFLALHGICTACKEK